MGLGHVISAYSLFWRLNTWYPGGLTKAVPQQAAVASTAAASAALSLAFTGRGLIIVLTRCCCASWVLGQHELALPPKAYRRRSPVDCQTRRKVFVRESARFLPRLVRLSTPFNAFWHADISILASRGVCRCDFVSEGVEFLGQFRRVFSWSILLWVSLLSMHRLHAFICTHVSSEDKLERMVCTLCHVYSSL